MSLKRLTMFLTLEDRQDEVIPGPDTRAFCRICSHRRLAFAFSL